MSDHFLTMTTTPHNDYLSSLSEKERHGLLIATTQLGSSFNLVKSIGYLRWLTKNQDAHDRKRQKIT